MRNSILILIVITTLFSCFHAKKSTLPEGRVEILRDSYGNLISEIPYSKDSLIHGVAKYYNRITYKLKEEVEFHYGKMQGVRKEYDSYGNIASISHFNNGLQHGRYSEYYSNGILKASSDWVEGVALGESKWYFPNGKLRLLNLIDYDKKVYYVAEFDSLGKPLFEEGVVFSPGFQVYPTSDSLFVGQSVEVRAMAVVVKDRITELVFEYSDTSFTYKLDNIYLTHQRGFSKAGKYHLKIKGRIFDLNRNLLKSQMEEFEFEVYN